MAATDFQNLLSERQLKRRLLSPHRLGIHDLLFEFEQEKIYGAQWLSGRVLDSRPKGRGFEPHRRHCVVALGQDTFILA